MDVSDDEATEGERDWGEEDKEVGESGDTYRVGGFEVVDGVVRRKGPFPRCFKRISDELSLRAIVSPSTARVIRVVQTCSKIPQDPFRRDK